METGIPGLYAIEVERYEDERGHFARIYCAEEFRAIGLELPDRQSAISHNRVKGTLRGLHFVEEAQGEAKLVRCVRGRVFDVAIDLRRDSPTFARHVSLELSAERQNAFFIPRGVAHGFITLKDNCDVLYQFSQPHRAGLEQGVRWDDPQIAIDWPCSPTILSDRDKGLPFLAELTV
jgi:dTDP-4-dehydrorhamnose 3,5-epimerase